MKFTMSLTGLVITISVVTLGIFDLTMVFVNGTGSSISDWLVSHGFHAPVMVFAFGFVAGHLFGNMVPGE